MPMGKGYGKYKANKKGKAKTNGVLGTQKMGMSGVRKKSKAKGNNAR